MPRALRLVLADDHAVVRGGLKALLQQRGLEVVAEASDGQGALDAYRQHRPDLVLLDLTMPPGMDGLEAARHLLAEGARVLLLTMHDDEALRRELLDVGVSGYVLKQAPEAELLAAIWEACVGSREAGTTPSGARSAERPRAVASARSLTEREEQILRLFAQGFGNKEIAVQLDISVKTVETHRGHLMLKLGLQSRAELVKFALQRGWL